MAAADQACWVAEFSNEFAVAPEVAGHLKAGVGLGQRASPVVAGFVLGTDQLLKDVVMRALDSRSEAESN